MEFKNFKLSEIDLEFRGYGQFQKILHQMSGPKKKIIESNPGILKKRQCEEQCNEKPSLTGNRATVPGALA